MTPVITQVTGARQGLPPHFVKSHPQFFFCKSEALYSIPRPNQSSNASPLNRGIFFCPAVASDFRDGRPRREQSIAIELGNQTLFGTRIPVS
jgi:hypothetical protein